MVLIARGFVVVAENKNQAEAEYRYALTRLRENGESLAMLGGEREERAGLDAAFTTVRKRWRELMMQYLRTTIVSQTSCHSRMVRFKYHSHTLLLHLFRRRLTIPEAQLTTGFQELCTGVCSCKPHEPVIETFGYAGLRKERQRCLDVANKL